jgi:peptidoglycan/xylan/chitin deacetylase (PgdA/CDA1 family)
MLVSLLLLLAAAPAGGPASAPAQLRSLAIDGKPLSFPARADAAGAPVAIDLVVSAEERPLLGTLLHRGWTPRDSTALRAHPEVPVLLDGRAPDLSLEHGGARIDERLHLFLWRRPGTLRSLPLWVGAAVRQMGVRPLGLPTRPPVVTQDAADRVLADFSFGLSQARVVAAQPRVTWVELAEAPPGAEELLPELPPAIEPPLQAAGPFPPGEPLLKPLPPPRPVQAEVITRPQGPVKRIALTFDACATLDRSFYDDRITRVRLRTRTPATLFISGRWAETHLREMRVLSEIPLFEIANHSYIHPHMTEVPEERQREELLWTQQILLSLTGKLPRFFRPPYGEIDPQLAQEAARDGLRTVEFDFPSGDPDKHSTRERLVAWVLAKARPGSIVVMHMNRRGWHTAEALPDIIAGLRAQGYVLSQVGEMVDAAPETTAW